MRGLRRLLERAPRAERQPGPQRPGLDAAITALDPVLALPPGERTAVEGQRLSVVRAGLARPPCQGSPLARSLDEQVAEFVRGDLGHLPAQQD